MLVILVIVFLLHNMCMCINTLYSYSIENVRILLCTYTMHFNITLSLMVTLCSRTCCLNDGKAINISHSSDVIKMKVSVLN